MGIYIQNELICKKILTAVNVSKFFQNSFNVMKLSIVQRFMSPTDAIN